MRLLTEEQYIVRLDEGVRQASSMPDVSEPSIWAGRETHPFNQPPPGFPTEGEADEGEDIRESDGMSSVGSNNHRKALGEDLPLTFCVWTEEAAHMQFQVNRAAHPGQVGDCSHIPRMNPR
jgi:hypothetical protein